MSTPIALNTGSIISNPNGSDGTFTALSTMIVVKVGPNAVGAIQSINIQETRNITLINELGTDGSVDSAPTSSTVITGDCKRIRFDRLRITEAFGRDFLHVHAQRIPFDIDIYDNWNGNGANSIITTVKNVWIKSLGYNYDTSNWLIVEDMSWQAEAISSTLNGGSAATGGLIGSNILNINPIEIQSDTGLRRGSLDAPGLIGAFFTNA